MRILLPILWLQSHLSIINNQSHLRNKLYTEAFIKKWGEGMTRIFIYRKDFISFLKDRGLDNIYNQGKFKELIKKILE